MVYYPGNSIPAPTYVQSETTVDDELLASTVGYTQKGVTLKPGQGVLLLGTLIAQDPTTKKYIKVTSDAEGLLRQTVDTGDTESAQGWQANILLTGLAKLDKVSSANSGVTLSTVLGAQINTVIGLFKF